MTDQEQVILRAIKSLAYSSTSPVLISDVIKAVGYPKAATKKILGRLANRGVIALHRHDYPASLTPAQRKTMVRLKDKRGNWSYFVAVTMPNPSSKKRALPIEWQVRPLSWGGARWQSRAEAGDDVYDRPFPKTSDLEWYLADNYGWRFARKVLAALATSKGEPVGTVKRNPTSGKGRGKKTARRVGKALKGAASALLGAGSEILGAGASALNPSDAEYVLQVYMKGAGWLDFGVYIDKAEATKAAQHRTNKHGAHTRVIDGATEKVIAEFKGNPGGAHLPGLPAKAQREYEHILAGAKAEGRYRGRQKEVAARTVRKKYGPNPHGMSEKAWKAEENKWRKSIAAYRAKGWSYQQIKDRLWLAYGLTLDKLDAESATFVDPFHRGQGFTLDLIGPLERRRMKKKTNPKRRRNADRIWQVYGGNKTAQAAAQEFARTYWAEPRKITGFKPDGTFKVVRGLRTYRVFIDGDVWVVEVIDDPIMQGRSNPDAPRYIATNVGMMKGFWKVVDTRTGETVHSGMRSKKAAQHQADSLNRHGHPSRIAGRKNPRRRQNRDYPYWNIYHVDTKKSPPYDKTYLGASSFGMTKAEAIEKFRHSHYPGRLRAGMKIVAEKGVVTKNPKRRRNAVSDTEKWERAWTAYVKALKALDKPLKGANARAARMRLGKAEKALQKLDPEFYQRLIRGGRNPGRKRNVEKRDSDHPIEVTRHYRAGPPGYMTPWQRAHAAGQSQLFETGIKPAKRRNPKRRRKGQVWVETGGTAQGDRVYKVYVAAPAYPDGTKVAESKNKSQAEWEARMLRKRISSKSRDTSWIWRAENPTRRKSPKRKGRSNPSAKQIREKFAGSVGPGRDLFFPKGTPPGQLAQLGRLVSITTDSGTIKPVAGSAWLCADTRGKLHLGSTGQAPLFDGPARNFGKVSKIEYEEKKPHLGYGKNPIIWFHHVGEETGTKPTLHADGAGGLVFKGGAYRLTSRGIEN